MSWLDKYCEKCGKKVDKNTAPQRFGKHFCSEEHAKEYAGMRAAQMEQAPKQKSGGGCC